MRSVAVDSAYVPLGSMLLIDAQDYAHSIKNIVFAQDRGAAIKSAVRADLFTGYGKEALAIAGNLKAAFPGPFGPLSQARNCGQMLSSRPGASASARVI
jgi:hypothetical protein